MGQGNPNPKLALGLIFGLIAIFLVILFALQRSDLERAAGSGAAATNRAAAEGGRQVENPMTMAEPDLWAALAIAPIDADAIRARDEAWDVGRRSIRLGMVIVALTFLTVPAIYLFETFLPLLIGAPLIVIAATFSRLDPRRSGPGGEARQGLRAHRPGDEAARPAGDRAALGRLRDALPDDARLRLPPARLDGDERRAPRPWRHGPASAATKTPAPAR